MDTSTLADAKPTRVRRTIVATFFVSFVINYIDSSSISIAGPRIQDDLGIRSSPGASSLMAGTLQTSRRIACGDISAS